MMELQFDQMRQITPPKLSFKFIVNFGAFMLKMKQLITEYF